MGIPRLHKLVGMPWLYALFRFIPKYFTFPDVIKKSTSISEWGSDVNLTCEFTGYHPKDICTIEWDHEGKSISQDYRKYTISQGFGTKGLSQSGGSFPDPSITSTLTISDVEQADVGIYGCRIIGSVGCNQVIGYIQVNKGTYMYAYIHIHTVDGKVFP